MEPDHWPQVERCLRELLELEPAQRAAALLRIDDVPLRREAESLLAHEAPAEEFLAAPAAAGSDALEAAGRTRIGPYRIDRLIARGGMGTVWLAERDDEQYRKKVALKLIRHGMETDEILSRFRHERQVQAALEHPHIVRLLDGGATEDGRPYLVMEHVEGVPILAHCDQRRMPVSSRLRLFQKVCGAVHYAHQNLVVHRDLKPGNILVTADGEPKLLDFGIAKVLHPEGAPAAEATAPDLRPMTLRYASPEQVRGEAVTTATDVYSLGVILYELLTGQEPYALSTRSRAEYERAVSSREPVRPSEAAARAGDRRLAARLRGDLDAIVRKAMRKEPHLRYPSAEQLGRDLERHLAGHAVSARKGTLVYNAGKFVRRNALLAGASALLLLALVGGTFATARLAGIAARERDAALVEARKAERVTRFLQTVLSAANPRLGGSGLSAVAALERAGARVHEEFGSEPEIESAVHAAVGQTWLDLGRQDLAEEHLHAALAILEGAGTSDSLAYAGCLNNLGALEYARGRHGRARSLTERALAMHCRLIGGRHADVATDLNNLAAIARAEGDLGRAEEHLRAALDLRRELFGDEHAEVAESLNNLCGLLRARGDLAAAEELARQVLAMRSRLLGPAHPDTVQSQDNLAVILAGRGDLPGAEALMRAAVARYREALPPDHPDLAQALNNLGSVLVERGDLEAADPVFQEALAIRQRALPPADRRMVETARRLAACRAASQRFGPAEGVLVRARADVEQALGAAHELAQALAGDLVGLYEAWGKPERAAALRAQLPRQGDGGR